MGLTDLTARTAHRIVAVCLVLLHVSLCENTRFPDRSTPPSLAPEAVSVVASLDHPPGNVAGAPNGDVFFTYHPVGYPTNNDCGPDKKSFCG